jgi:hypothetical protein
VSLEASGFAENEVQNIAEEIIGFSIECKKQNARISVS